jgi:hypothetical protein
MAEVAYHGEGGQNHFLEVHSQQQQYHKQAWSMEM